MAKVVWFLVGVSLIFIFVAKQDSLARLVWQKYGRADAAFGLKYCATN